MKKLISITIVIACLIGCSFKLQPQVSLETLDSKAPKLPVNILLYLPEDFESYEYVASHDGREIRYNFGKSAATVFPEYMNAIFTSLRTDNNLKGNCVNEFIASPSFIQPNSYVKPFVFGIEIKIKVDFTSCDRTKMFSVSGKGEGTANIYTEGNLLQAGNEAINSSLIDLRNKIIQKFEQLRQ